MRRRHVTRIACLGGLLIAVVTAAPAGADPVSSSAPGAPVAVGDPVDLSVGGAASTVLPPPTQRGTSTSFAFVVQGTSPDSTFAVKASAGFTIASVGAGATVLTCTPTAVTEVCDLGAISGYTTVVVGVAIPASTPIGTAVRVTATVTPVPGPDSNPANNTAVLDDVVSGHLDLTQTAPREPVLVVEPGSGTFLYSLHNSGPDPATGVQVTFSIGGTDDPLPVFEDFGGATVVTDHGSRVWKVGSIASGGTATLQVTLHATAPVRDSDLSWTAAYDAVPLYCFHSASCGSNVQILSVPGGTVPPNQPTTVQPRLADTGSADRGLTAVGLGLVAAGGAVVATGRRRRA